MSIPSKPRWRWMLSLSPGSQLCHCSRDNRGDTKLLLPLGKKNQQKTVMSFQNSMVCSQSSSGETKRCQVFDEIQSNTLKQTFWQFIPVKPKVMFPFVLKKDYQHWHLSYNSHATACLFASRAWNGVSFKERSALIWQSQTCFKSGTL